MTYSHSISLIKSYVLILLRGNMYLPVYLFQTGFAGYFSLMGELAVIYKILGITETIAYPILTQHSVCPAQAKPRISAFIVRCCES